MPSLRGAEGNRKRRWRARVKRLGQERFLGYYDTREEAAEAERRYKARYAKAIQREQDWANQQRSITVTQLHQRRRNSRD